MFLKHISSKIAAHFQKNEKFIVALSGGPDSVFLAESLTRILPKNQLVFAHFDHCLRDSSSKDAQFCSQFSEQKGIFFISECWKNPQQSEEKARNARYEFLERIRIEHNADAIVLGTHFDDLVETVFFRFLRGSGARGLSGICEFDTKTRRFRPLLEIQKFEILEFLKQEKIPFQTDETNAESAFSRNFLRNEIFPKLDERFPFFRKNLVRQAKIFREIADFLEKSAFDFFENLPHQNDQIQVPKIDFFNLPLAIRREVVRLFFAPKTPDFEIIESLLHFIATAKNGKKMLFRDFEVLVFGDNFFLSRKNSETKLL